MLATIIASFLLAQVTAVTAPAPSSSSYTGTRIDLPKVDRAPAIDGTLNDPAWKTQAAKVLLQWNLRDQQPANQTTTAYVLTDNKYLYVGFDAQQRQAVQAGQHTNDSSLTNDDDVVVYLWPNGAKGFTYSFAVNPIGTHVATSSENTAYAPSWQSAGHRYNGGYTVTMRIPLAAIKGGNGGTWGLQFARFVASTQDDYVWQHASTQGQGSEASSIYSGFLTGVPVQAGLRPKPRLGVYELAEIASPSIGGSTSRVGADISLPVTTSTSFVATLHPDYSNVELDQQTIQPTAYARFYQEVRPFFTQLDNFFNNASCIGCTGQEFYSPFVPTPRAGYAVEGKEGPASFAAFDAAGTGGRSDTAQALRLQSKDTKTNLFAQRVNVSMPGLYDNNTMYNLAHDSLKGLFEYATYGTDSGTLVTDASQAHRHEAGIGLYGRNGGIYFADRHLGSQYAPVDGLFQQSDIAGYDLNGDYTWYYKSTSFFPRVIVAGNLDRYHGTGVGLNQTDTWIAAGADIKKLWHLRLQTGSAYLRLPSGTFTPVSQNGVDLSYNYHTPTVTQLSWYTGRFGPGRTDVWIRSTTLKAGPRGYLSLEADDNVQWLDIGNRYTSWLEKATYTYANGSDSSIGIGVRRIIGQFPVLENGTPNPYLNGWNLSFAYHARLPHAELYLVYGDANAFQTAPRFVIKLIEYAGAEKGT
jgi:hypothetical protein